LEKEEKTGITEWAGLVEQDMGRFPFGEHPDVQP